MPTSEVYSNIGQHENFCSDYYNNYKNNSPERPSSNSNQLSPPRGQELQNALLDDSSKNSQERKNKSLLEEKIRKFHQLKMTSIHHILFKLKDKLSGCNEDPENSIVPSIREVYSEKRGPAGGTDEMMSEQGQLLFEQDDNLEEMKSADDVANVQQLEINDKIKKNQMMDLWSFQETDEKLDVQFDSPPKQKKRQFLEMASLADSGGLDPFGSNAELDQLVKDENDQNSNGSDF